jgi:hypothetical protein
VLYVSKASDSRNLPNAYARLTPCFAPSQHLASLLQKPIALSLSLNSPIHPASPLEIFNIAIMKSLEQPEDNVHSFTIAAFDVPLQLVRS